MKSLRNNKKNINKNKETLRKIRKQDYLRAVRESYSHKRKKRANKILVGDVVIIIEGELSCG